MTQIILTKPLSDEKLESGLLNSFCFQISIFHLIGTLKSRLPFLFQSFSLRTPNSIWRCLGVELRSISEKRLSSQYTSFYFQRGLLVFLPRTEPFQLGLGCSFFVCNQEKDSRTRIQGRFPSVAHEFFPISSQSPWILPFFSVSHESFPIFQWILHHLSSSMWFKFSERIFELLNPSAPEKAFRFRRVIDLWPRII